MRSHQFKLWQYDSKQATGHLNIRVSGARFQPMELYFKAHIRVIFSVLIYSKIKIMKTALAQ